MTAPLYRNVYPEQEDLISALTERYADQRIRFDSGFNGSVPVQATGRIGRQFFYFRFRGDTASLTLGAADHRGAASRAKHARRKALRTLRRGIEGDDLWGFMVERDLKRNDVLDRHPSRVVWCAVANDVTGEQYAGALEPEESAELFIDLMASLQLAGPAPTYRKFRQLRRGNWTPPSHWAQGIIRKPSKNRR